jgi:type I restriction enzyme R subunit
MTKQSEAILETNLIKQLINLGYEHAPVHNEDELLGNLKRQLEKFNNTSFSEKEFNNILNHLAKGNVFEKSKTLKDRFKSPKRTETSNTSAFLIRII